MFWKDASGHRHSVLKTTGFNVGVVSGRKRDLYGGERAPPPTWQFNDFGPIAVRYFEDTNHDGRLDEKEHLSGEMFHTTAENEAEAARFRADHPDSSGEPPVKMVISHGCIHLRPTQLHRLLAAGAFRRGNRLIVHAYSEHAH